MPSPPVLDEVSQSRDPVVELAGRRVVVLGRPIDPGGVLLIRRTGTKLFGFC